MTVSSFNCHVLVATLGLSIGAAAGHAAAQDTTGATTQLGGPSAQQQSYCRQLERDLGPDWQQNGGARDAVPRLEAQMSRADQQLQRSQAAAERADCFDYFLFSKTWRDTPQCRQIHQQIDDAQHSLAELDRQRKAAFANQDHASRQDVLLNELARNGCGPQYVAAVQRTTGSNSAGFWSDGEGIGPSGAVPGFGNLVPGSTFRTICVRTCDGYYFPISFATTQDRLQHDAQVCQSQCGAPAKLYYYPNPGGEVQQAVGLDGAPYTALPNAFRYRKELVSTCSCKSPGGETDPIADAQTMPLTSSRAAGSVTPPDQTDNDGAGALPPAEFGTMSVEPANPDQTPGGQTN
jgi:hypothetical protein